MELVEEFHKMAQGNGEALQEYQPEEKVISSYNYFCVFCLRPTLMDNLGNFGRCQECKMEGSNHSSACMKCKKGNQYVYRTEDDQLVCAQCTGKTIWSGPFETSVEESNCSVCLKNTHKNQYSIASECVECNAIKIPQTVLKISKCNSCPLDAHEEEKELSFFIIDGELKCEDCSIQDAFQK